MSEWIINARALTKSYPGTAGRVLDGVNLQVSRGQSLAIMGPSGSGKSTLLNLLNGLIVPDDGELQLFGRSTDSMKEKDRSALRRYRIATVFQDSNLIPTLSLARNVAFRAGLAGRTDPTHEQQIIHHLGIADVAARYPDQVSGGQRQRGAIAAAFAMGPELLLADEPTGSLDERNAQNVAALFFEGIRARRLTAILVTHNLDLARRCDQILELAAGALHPLDTAPTASARHGKL